MLSKSTGTQYKSDQTHENLDIISETSNCLPAKTKYRAPSYKNPDFEDDAKVISKIRKTLCYVWDIAQTLKTTPNLLAKLENFFAMSGIYWTNSQVLLLTWYTQPFFQPLNIKFNTN